MRKKNTGPYIIIIGMTNDLTLSAMDNGILGFGRSVVERLVKTSVKKNLYYEIKEKVVEEAFNGYRVNKNKQLVRIFGIDSTKDVRARLIEILYERVAYHKDKFIAKVLHDEMEAMEVKPNGKVEHSDKTHDDQVFSYLMALYVWYDGHDIMQNFNIQKNTIRTDEDEEVVEGDIEAGTDMTKIDVSSSNEVDNPINTETEKFIKDATKYKLQKDFNDVTYTSEQDVFNAMMGMDKSVKDAYNAKYNVETNDGTSRMTTLPSSLFIDDDAIDPEEASKILLHGNMFDDFVNL